MTCGSWLSSGESVLQLLYIRCLHLFVCFTVEHMVYESQVSSWFVLVPHPWTTHRSSAVALTASGPNNSFHKINKVIVIIKTEYTPSQYH